MRAWPYMLMAFRGLEPHHSACTCRQVAWEAGSTAPLPGRCCGSLLTTRLLFHQACLCGAGTGVDLAAVP